MPRLRAAFEAKRGIELMDAEITTNEGISRRTIVKGAAWSIPVMAAAVAAPAAVATGGPTWDVTVAGSCLNDYKDTALAALIPGALTQTVRAALALVGLTRPASRTFTITATAGTVPAGTTFSMSYPAGLIDIVALEGLIEVNALTVVTIDSTHATFTLNTPLTQGQFITINIINAILDVGALSSVTLSLVGNDNPANPGTEGADSATVTTLLSAGGYDLGQLGIPLVSGTLAVQICG
jgi:hypothetical protein